MTRFKEGILSKHYSFWDVYIKQISLQQRTVGAFVFTFDFWDADLFLFS